MGPRIYSHQILLLGCLGVAVSALMAPTGPTRPNTAKWDSTTRLSQVLEDLGQEERLHTIDELDSNLVQKGKELITKGKTTKPDGNKTARQSKYYACTDCHNIQQENPDLSNPNPADRLAYAMKNDIPFLQGTTLYGVVNRETWYNGDYQEKYGEAAKKAKDTLRNAIQLCATTCSQGRKFTEWEMEAVLHFLNAIELKLGDLALPDTLLEKIRINRESDARKGLIKEIKTHYYTASEATFADALPTPDREMGKEGDPELGEAIYEKSCRQCHSASGPTRFTLDYSVLTFNQLTKHLDAYKDKSLYQITRYGTSPIKGYRPYMPQYPLERLSREQVEHLAAFVRQESSREP